MFTINDFVIDRVLYGWAESLTGDILYTLKQMTNPNISLQADSKDSLDARDMLVKRFYNSKSGTFSVDSTVLSFSTLGNISGSEISEASNSSQVEMPKFSSVDSGDTIQLSSPITSTIQVYGQDINGNLGVEYEQGTSSSATTWSIDSNGLLTAPTTDATYTRFIVKYQKNSNNGIKIVNMANRFPKLVCLNLKAIGIDPCEPDCPKIIYIKMPNFQPSPEITIDFNTEGNITYTGSLLPDVCSEDHKLFDVYAMSEAEEAVEYPAVDLGLQVLTRPTSKTNKTDNLVTENDDNYKVDTYLKRFLRENYAFT